LTYHSKLYGDVTVKSLKNDEEYDSSQIYTKEFLGYVPIMLRSSYCLLYESSDSALTQFGECPYDQGFYLIKIRWLFYH
jgi:DNA-directed RNA polymerase II subunit RPB2